MHADIQRYTDAQHLNSILNDPDVFPGISGGSSDSIDMTPVMEGPGVVALYGKHGGQVYHHLQPALWEAHSAFLKEGRGQYALDVTRKTLHWIFTRTDACEIVTRCPEGNLGAKQLAKLIGGEFQCTLAHGWVKDSRPIPADVYSLTVQSWMKSSPDLVESGRRFHDKLQSEFDRLGISEPPHENDETHDRYVGAAYEMMLGGQPEKACIFYNRIAMLASWHLISIVNFNPLAIDIGSAILVMRGDDFIAIPPPKPAQ